MASSMCAALVSWPAAPLTESLVCKALRSTAPAVEIMPSIPDEFRSQIKTRRLLQWSTYDDIDHELTHLHRENVLSCTYTFRKALIRKHFLSRTIHSYTTKYPDSILKDACPKTYELELSFADELDAMWMDELWELGECLDDPGQSWWILKPGMADRGMGIRMFNSKEDLERIFEEFDGDSDDDDNNDSNVEKESSKNQDMLDDSETVIVTSQLRHFVIQEYVLNPLLLDPEEVPIGGGTKPEELHARKFHLRAYVVASGALQVFLYSRILALFSAVPYMTPSVSYVDEGGENRPLNLAPHLTNTSLQTGLGECNVRLLNELIGCKILSGEANKQLTEADVKSMVDQMKDILADTFKAALQNPVHFQPLPNAFELYGVDFLVGHTPSAVSPFQVKILEINAEPAIELTGPRLSWILEDLFISIEKVCVDPFFSEINHDAQNAWQFGEVRNNLIKCLEERVRGEGGAM